jgi:hypothetical protein
MRAKSTLSSLVSFSARLRGGALALLLCAPLAACDDGPSSVEEPEPDAPLAPPCFAGTPKTHEELINACTTGIVEKIDKRPALPLMGGDGKLPPLP